MADHRVALSRRVCTSLGLLENLAVAGMPLDGPQDRADSGYLHRRTLLYKMLQPLGDIAATPLRRSFAAQTAPCICVQTHSVCPANKTVDRYAIGVIYYPPSSLLRTNLRLYSYGIHDNISR